MLNYRTILAAFVAVLTIVSCEKKVPDTQEPDKPTPSKEDPKPSQEGYAYYSITASTTADAPFTDSDKIKVLFDGGSSVSEKTEPSSDGLSATITVALPEDLGDAAKLYAVRPSTAEASLDNGVLSVVVPAEQKAGLADARIAAASTSVSGKDLKFKPVVGLVSFEVSAGNPKNISKAMFKDLYGANLTGTLPVTFTSSGDVTIGEISEPGQVVTVTEVKEGKNYIAVVPGAELQSEAIKFGTASAWLTPSAQGLEWKIDKGTVKELAITDAEAGDAYYIKAGAAGKGTSWADAAPVSKIAEVMSTASERRADTFERRVAAWRLDGFEFRIAEGTYELPQTEGQEFLLCDLIITDVENSAAFTIDGGFDASGNASSSAKATFTGNGEHPILALYTSIDATVKNIIFRDGLTGTDGVGGAVLLDNSVQASFENCDFLSNKNTGGEGGGAAYIAASGTVASFKNCLFQGNETATGDDQKGGAMKVGNADVTITDCIFKDNKADGYGGAVYYNADGLEKSLEISGSTFEGNSAGRGTVMLYNGLNAKISGCTFNENNSSWGSNAVIGVQEEITVEISNCVFTNNNGGGNSGGMIRMVGNKPVSIDGCLFEENNRTAVFVNTNGADAIVKINATTFKKNNSGGRGGAIHECGEAPVFVNGCVFIENTSGSHGASIAMEGDEAVTGKMGINNCSFYDRATGIDDQERAVVMLTGKSIVANSTILGTGTTPALCYYSSNYGHSTGSILVNSVIAVDQYTGDGCWSPLNLIKWGSTETYKINGGYNIFQRKRVHNGPTEDYDYFGENDSVIPESFSAFNPSVDNGVIDYTVPTGYTAPQPTLAQVEAIIKSQADFGEAFYSWLTEIGAVGKDVNGNARTDSNNRPGALVK